MQLQQLEQGGTLPQDILKVYLKRHNLELDQSKELFQKLKLKKIQKKVIRNYLYHHGEQISKVFWLIKGSVQIVYPASNNSISSFHGKVLNSKNKTLLSSNQIKVFAQLQTLFDIINDESVLYLKNRGVNLQEKLSKSRQKLSHKEKLMKSKHVVKQRYSALVCSSQVYFLELAFQEAYLLLKDRLSLIEHKQSQRQAIINEMSQNQNRFKKHENEERMIEKMSLPSINLKNIHPANQNIEKYQLRFKDRSTQPRQTEQYGKNHFSVSKKSEKSIEKQKSAPKKSKIRCSKGVVGLKVPSLAEKMIKKLQNAIQEKNRSDEQTRRQFDSQYNPLIRNQQILHQYRSRLNPQAAQYIQKRSMSEKYIKEENEDGNPRKNLKRNTTQASIDKPKQTKNEKLFKEQLKGIIKKKLKFEKQHGKILKDFLNEHEEQSENRKHLKSIKSNQFSQPLNNPQIHQSLKTIKIGNLSPTYSKSLIPKSQNAIPNGNYFGNAHLSERKIRNALHQQQTKANEFEIECSEGQMRSSNLYLRRKMLDRITQNEENIDNYFLQ